MVGLKKFEGKTLNKQISFRIFTESPAAEIGEFLRDLRALFEEIATKHNIEKMLDAHKKAEEILNVLPS